MRPAEREKRKRKKEMRRVKMMNERQVEAGKTLERCRCRRAWEWTAKTKPVTERGARSTKEKFARTCQKKIRHGQGRTAIAVRDEKGSLTRLRRTGTCGGSGSRPFVHERTDQREGDFPTFTAADRRRPKGRGIPFRSSRHRMTSKERVGVPRPEDNESSVKTSP